MKKFIVLGLFGLLIMAFSATAYAQPKLEFKASGFMEAVSFLYRNITPGDPGLTVAQFPAAGFWTPWYGAASSGAWNRTNSYMEYRGVLRFDAIMGKELSGTIMFEMDSNRWGDQSVAGDNRNRTGFWTGDRNAVEIKNLYIDFALPYLGIPAPMTVRVGLQPLGARPHIFMTTDGMGVTGGIKFEPVLIGLTWAKAWEGRDATADDVNVYGVNINAKIGPVTPGFFAYNFNMDSYPIPNGANPTAYGALPANNTANMWWLGFYLDGKLGPLNLNFDVVWDTGKVKVKDNFNSVWPDVKYNGWATQLKVVYPWEKFDLGGVFMYASGADLRKTNYNGIPGAAGTVADGTAAPTAFPRKVGAYVIPPGSEEWAAWGESMILGSNYITATATPLGMFPSLATYGTNMQRGAIGGTWIAKLFAGFKPISWYKVTFQGLYIGDTTKHGNTLNRARRVTGINRDDNTIGWELDLIQDIQIYNNLKWSIGLGYLFAGKALDLWEAPTGVITNTGARNPWILATKLRYDF